MNYISIKLLEKKKEWWQNAWNGMERMKTWPLVWACGTDRKTLLWPVAGNLGAEGIPLSSTELSVQVADGGQLQRWLVGVLPPQQNGDKGQLTHALGRVRVGVRTLNY